MSDISYLLTGLVPASTIHRIEAAPREYLGLPLSHIGVDSLSTFEILDRIEERLGYELDYDALSYESFSTLGGVMSLLQGSQGNDHGNSPDLR